MPEKNAGKFSEVLNMYLNLRERDASWLASRLPPGSPKSNKSRLDAGTVRRWCNGETTPGDSVTIDLIVRELDISDERDRIALYTSSGFPDITTIIHAYYRHEGEVVDEAEIDRHIRRYLTWVQNTLGVVNLRGLKKHGPVPLPLSEVYVPLTAEVRSDWASTGRSQELRMDRLLSVAPRLVVTGGPGSGKTTVLQHVAWTLATALLTDAPGFAADRLGLNLKPDEALPIPVFAPISLYATHLQQHRNDRRRRTLTAFLSEYLVGCEGVPGLPDEFFARLLESGRGIFLLLDGLDEVPDQDDRSLVRAQIESLFAGAAGLHLRAIVTCCTQAYKGDATLAGGFREVRVEPLQEPHIRALVEKAYQVYYADTPRLVADKSEEMIIGIRRLEAERRAHMGEDEPPLISTLLMVRLLLIVHLNAGQMPKHRVELYKEAVEKLLFPDYGPDVEAQAYLRKLLTDNPKTYRNMMQHIAVALHTRGRTQGRTLDATALQQVLASSPYASYVEPLIELTSLRGGLLDERNRRYQFMHLAMQEYLVARYLGETVRSEGGIKAIAAYLQQNALGESWWREVALLTVGYLYDIDTEYAAELVRQLAACDDGRGAAAAPYHAAALAADGCLEWLADDVALRQTLTDRLVMLVNDKSLMAVSPPTARAVAGDALARLGDPRPGVTVRADNGLPDIAWCKIPELGPHGQREFLHHDGTRNTPHPGLPTFWISKYPVTYAQLWAFVDASDGYCNGQWWRKPPGKNQSEAQSHWRTRGVVANRPAEDMTWEEIVAFCNWLVDKMRTHTELQPDKEIRDLLSNGGVIRPPTEEEWVKAARGWNDQASIESGPLRTHTKSQSDIEMLSVLSKGGAIRLPTEEDWVRATLPASAPVGMFPQYVSPFGVEDMGVIVKEYCFQDSLNYPNGKKDLWRAFRVLRSGIKSRISEIDFEAVDITDNDGGADILDFDGIVGYGFRVVCATSP